MMRKLDRFKRFQVKSNNFVEMDKGAQSESNSQKIKEWLNESSHDMKSQTNLGHRTSLRMKDEDEKYSTKRAYHRILSHTPSHVSEESEDQHKECGWYFEELQERQRTEDEEREREEMEKRSNHERNSKRSHKIQFHNGVKLYKLPVGTETEPGKIQLFIIDQMQEEENRRKEVNERKLESRDKLLTQRRKREKVSYLKLSNMTLRHVKWILTDSLD